MNIHSTLIIVRMRKKFFIQQNIIFEYWQVMRSTVVTRASGFHCSIYCPMWKCGIQRQSCGKPVQETIFMLKEGEYTSFN